MARTAIPYDHAQPGPNGPTTSAFAEEYTRDDANGTPNESIDRSCSTRVKAPVAVLTPSPRIACRASVIPSATPHPHPLACPGEIGGGTIVSRGFAFGDGFDTTSCPSPNTAAIVMKYVFAGSSTHPSPASSDLQNSRTAPHGSPNSSRDNSFDACSVLSAASYSRTRQRFHPGSSSLTSK